MLDPSAPNPVWVIWPHLSWIERLSFFALCILAVYSFLLALSVLRFHRTTGVLNRAAPIQTSSVDIGKRVRNLQQATLAAFYLFGFVLFESFQSAYRVIENTSIPGGWVVVRNFQIHFAFAGNAFFAFLVCHVIQWFAANRVATMTLQSNS
jgi:hypothetical protein